ncbi:polysaccharide biosynthesis tyrosine autokinase [Knoellia sp. p5-6-4]|uniref:polysaccharide biosynthesis tyrosine autokinase n=1 Tax=unclassified Knoellia TaxID=2618719 RepID=UPI0023D9F778|nr:polysaccharide biosynthesis tyrosine autokinase [Knoellia sp. p5-6-4]MDF2145439.1 polysaccharide biosynthesis tyrosine autokinase [Knoellia sp. p5-6-4]
MDLHDYLRVVRKRWRTIVAVTLALVAVAALVTLWSPKVYQAHTQLFVSTSAGDDSSQLLQGSSFTQQRVKSYSDVITTPTVLNPVIDELDLQTDADRLGRQISASVPLDTVLIDVMVNDADPQQAARIADAVGKQFSQTVAELERVSDRSASPVKVSVVRPPSTPSTPVSPKPARNVALGVVLGLMLGLGAALLRDLLDTSIRTERDVKDVTEETVIGGVHFDADSSKRPLIVQADPHGPRAEAFRALRTNLQFIDAATHPRSMTFTSSLPGEGKTTTTVNLAISMAAAGSRVCLVEGDLRRPRMLKYMGLENSVGLTNVLIGQADLDDVLQPFGNSHIQVLGAGQIPPNPSELLGSEAMSRTVRELEAKFDYVIIDAPPLLPVTDAAVLSTITGGTVVIVGCDIVHKEQLTRGLEALRAVGGNVLGLVVNRIPTKGADAESYYYREGYAPQLPAQSRKERSKDRRGEHAGV